MAETRNTSTRRAESAGPSKRPQRPDVECRYCHQWASGAEDIYCGFCGKPLLALEIQPDSLILISGLAAEKELSIRNAGTQPVHATIVPRTSRFPALAFDPAGTFDIEPGAEVKIRVSLDASQLPAEVQEVTLDYVCINNDTHTQVPFKIAVRTGPRPRLLTPILQFGEIQEGRSVERPLEIANSGSIPLNLREVSVESSSHLRLKDPFIATRIDPGQKLTIAILWDSAVEETTPPSEPTGVRLRFGNYSESVFVPARARTFRYKLAVNPTTLRLTDVLSKEDVPAQLTIENQGTVDLEITAIESNVPWLEIVSRMKSFTLRCVDAGDGQPSTAQLSPTTISGTHAFKVICHPQSLDHGKHTATITIRTVTHEPKLVAVEIDVVKPRPYEDYIGIDFGTSNSVVAILNQETSEIELVEHNEPGSPRSPLIPSVLFFNDAESYSIGLPAKNAIPTGPDQFVRSIKRILGYDHERTFFGHSFTPEELASKIIKKLVRMAEQKLRAQLGVYYDVQKAIITVPANFFDQQIRSLLEACKAAGLDVEEEKVRQAAERMRGTQLEDVTVGVILDEPSAAILYYIYHLSGDTSKSNVLDAANSQEGGLHLLVFDYGGGTLDVSIANVTRRETGEVGIKILANMGDNGIGGDSIDLILMQEMLKRCKQDLKGFDFDTTLISANFKELEARCEKESWSKEVWGSVLGVRSAWKDLAERVKIRFSNEGAPDQEILPELIVVVTDGKLLRSPKGAKVIVPREYFENTLLQDTMKKCRQLISSALSLAELEFEQIDYIFHTGRQSLLRLVRSEVRGLFPKLTDDRDILDAEQLKVCVAKGAVLYGWMRDRLIEDAAKVHFLNEGRRLPHSYGVEKFATPLRPEFDEIIPRGAVHPVEKEKNYPQQMIQGSGYLNLKFYQNTGVRKDIVRNPEISLIGQILFNTMADGEPGCTVRFIIDANRKLEVFADKQPVPIKPARLQGEESWMS